MLLSVLEISCTLRCILRTLNVVVHCKGVWLSPCELYSLYAVFFLRNSLCAVLGV
jgi:hypothetical protein